MMTPSIREVSDANGERTGGPRQKVSERRCRLHAHDL